MCYKVYSIVCIKSIYMCVCVCVCVCVCYYRFKAGGEGDDRG